MKTYFDRINLWLKENAPAFPVQWNEGILDDAFIELENYISEPLTEDFKELYRNVNGNKSYRCLYGNLELLPIDRIEEMLKYLHQDSLSSDEHISNFKLSSYSSEVNTDEWRYSKKWIPFATDGDMYYVCLDLDPTDTGVKGQIIYVFYDNKVIGVKKVTNSLNEWLDNFTNDLENGGYIYNKDHGLITIEQAKAWNIISRRETDEEILNEIEPFLVTQIYGTNSPVESILERLNDIITWDHNRPDLLPQAKALQQKILLSHQSEQEGWLEPTDCDKLTQCFNILEQNNIITGENFGNTLSAGLEDIMGKVYNLKQDGQTQNWKGYVFYHTQDLESVMEHSNLHLAFGSFDDHDNTAYEVGLAIVDTLKKAGFNVSWSKTVNQRIKIEGMVWKKRR